MLFRVSSLFFFCLERQQKIIDFEEGHLLRYTKYYGNTLVDKKNPDDDDETWDNTSVDKKHCYIHCRIM